GQRLVEEGSDHVEGHRLPGRQRRAALRADLAPSQDADEYLQERHGNRHADPAQAGNVDAGDEVGKVDLAQREIQERRRDQYLQRRRQDTAHLARAGFEKGCKKRCNSAPWYGFQADLAIAGLLGVAAASATQVKRRGQRFQPLDQYLPRIRCRINLYWSPELRGSSA